MQRSHFIDNFELFLVSHSHNIKKYDLLDVSNEWVILSTKHD